MKYNPLRIPISFTQNIKINNYDYNGPIINHLIPTIAADEVFIPITHSPLIYNVISDRYYVSNYGRIFDKCNNCFLHYRVHNRGYLKVTLYCYITPYKIALKELYVHRLVAYYFLAPKDWTEETLSKLEVNHIDGIKTNNTVWNLEWCTPQYNIYHAKVNHLIKSGEDHPFAKLTNNEVEDICKMMIEGKSTSEIANITGLDSKLISSIRSGDSYVNIGKKYNVQKTLIKRRKQLDKETAIKICTLMMEGASTKKIMEETGASYSQIHDFKYTSNFKDIKSLFKMEKARSAKENNRDLDPEMVHKICQMLADGKNAAEIGRLTGVGRGIVNGIKNCGAYSEISENYIFPRARNRTDQNDIKDIKKICELLEQNMNIKDIEKIVGKSRSIITDIKNGKRYTEISSKYNIIPTPKPNTPRLEEMNVRNICRLIKSGKTNREIQQITGVSEYIVSNIRHKKSYINIVNEYNF